MSMGFSALRAITDAGAVNLFRTLKPIWFLEDEVETYKFIKRHVKQYGLLPDNKTLRENGFQLPAVNQPAQYYVDRISNRAVYNAVSETQEDLTNAMRDKDIPAIKTALASMIQATRVADNKQDYCTFAEQGVIVLEKYRAAKRSPGLQGITLGDPPLDAVTNGAQPGDVIVIAGRPNVGKSYKLLNMMKAAHTDGFAPMGCSMEMTNNQLATRYIGMLAGLNPDYIRRGELSTQRGERALFSTIQRIANMPPLHFIEGNFRKSVADVDNMVQQFSPDILFIDAGYLLRPENPGKNYSKADYIGMVMEEIKCMAQDRNIPVIVSVQLNREAARAGKKGLDLSFLAGTDVIGQVSTVCIGLTKGKPPYEEMQRQCQIIKNREGALLNYSMNFTFSPMRFDYIPASEFDEASGHETAEVQAAVQAEVEQMRNTGWQV